MTTTQPTIAESAQPTVKSLGDTFKLDPSFFAGVQAQQEERAGINVLVYPPTQFTPSINADYKFTPEILRRVLVWLQSHAFAKKMRIPVKRNLYIYGPTGAGKTELVRQLCARLGRSLFQCQAKAGRDPVSELYGGWVLRGDPSISGSSPVMTWVDGPILQWARTPNACLLIDEGDQMDAEAFMSLNGILDGHPILVPQTGELVKISDGCVVAVTGNTNGSGSLGQSAGSASLYKGTKRLNIATMERFFVISVGYLPEEEEQSLLVGYGADSNIAIAMAKLASAVRSSFMGLSDGDGSGQLLPFTLTTRNLLNWFASFTMLQRLGMKSGDALTEGLRMCLLDFASVEDAQGVLKTLENIIG
ncbi:MULTISPECIES: AAA family ATPase [Herbaspirillum]|uniref:MoxR family ATPase n=2 Tax=Herbaspirillum huttiense TaxID=863372 RepID=A0AAJ2LW01_9BURK|nr:MULTISPECIES: MoxR family ATPase [Herbaspirillum]MDR9837033.1 MoxR family ATPase [Herbaspirillum huttiense]